MYAVTMVRVKGPDGWREITPDEATTEQKQLAQDGWTVAPLAISREDVDIGVIVIATRPRSGRSGYDVYVYRNVER